MSKPSTAKNIQKILRDAADSTIAERSRHYVKTGKGEYGEGDQFLGIRVPTLRSLAKQYTGLPLAETLTLLRSAFHEERLLAVFILVQEFARSNNTQQKRIYSAYLKNSKYINGWDLVDSSAHQIVGAYLLDKDRSLLSTLAKSPSLWERRISIIATLHYIRLHQYSDTLKISRLLLNDKEDLIHKAVGWMLREVGNRDRKTEEQFLLKHYEKMPRTMLRYAIEKFDSSERQLYLTGNK